MKSWGLTATLCLVCYPLTLDAQRSFPAEPNVGVPIFAGAGLGLVGMVAGGVLGFTLDTSCDNTSNFCLPVYGAFLGSGVVGTLGVVEGTHLGNRRRGKIGTVFLVSGVVWGAGFGLAHASRNTSNTAALILITLPLVQLAATVYTERKTGDDNEAAFRTSRTPARAFVTPNPGGGVRVGVKIALPR